MKEIINALSELRKSLRDYQDEDLEIRYNIPEVTVEDVVRTEDNTYVQVSAEIEVVLKGEDRYLTTTNIINIPYKEELGYFFNGNYRSIVSSETMAPGFAFQDIPKEKYPSVKIVPVVYGKGFKTTYYLEVNKSNSTELKVYNTASSRTGASGVNLGILLRALTGITYQDILKRFGNYPKLLSTLKSEPTREKAASIVNDAFGYRINHKTDMIVELRNRFFNGEYLAFDSSAFEKLDNNKSWERRVLGHSLDQDIELWRTDESKGLVKTMYRRGTAIVPNLARLLDLNCVESLKVRRTDGKSFTLKSFYSPYLPALGCFEKVGKNLEVIDESRILQLKEDGINSLIVYDSTDVRGYRPYEVVSHVHDTSMKEEDLYQVISIWLDNLVGYGIVDKDFAAKGQKFHSIETQCADMVQVHLGVLKDSIVSMVQKMKLSSSTESLTDIMATVMDKWDPMIVFSTLKTDGDRTVQQGEVTNSIASVAASDKIAKDVARVSDAMANVHGDQFNRTDPFDIQESANFAKVSTKTYLSRERNGELLSPYYLVKDGRPTEELVEVSPLQEEGAYIVSYTEVLVNEDGTLKETVEARIGDILERVSPKVVKYQECSVFGDMSYARAQVPLQNHNVSKRTVMGTVHQKQAVPTMGSEKAFLRTGGESLKTAFVIYAEDILDQALNSVFLNENKTDFMDNAVVVLTSAMTPLNDKRSFVFEIRYNGKTHEIRKEVPWEIRSEQEMMVSYALNTKTNLVFKKGDPVLYTNTFNTDLIETEVYFDGGHAEKFIPSFDISTALGKNLFVAYKTWGSSTIDDAIVISDRLLGTDALTVVQVHKITFPVKDVEGHVTNFINFGNEAGIDDEGKPKIGRWVKSGDLLIGRSDPKIDSFNEVKQVQRYEVVPENTFGKVVSVDINKEEIIVYISSYMPVETGDKMTGRGGNKGVIAQIVPEHLMPFDPETGRTIDLILNPLGVPSRGNLSQILEVVLTMQIEETKTAYVMSPYYKDLSAMIEQGVENYKADNGEKIKTSKYLMDGRTGRQYDRPMTVGYIYFELSHHKIQRKFSSAGDVEKINQITQQPAKGRKNKGGQTVGEMEMHCLMSYDARQIMQEIYSLMSTDQDSYEQYKDEVNSDPFKVYSEGFSSTGKSDISIDTSRETISLENNNDEYLQVYIRSMGMNMKTDANNGEISLLTMTDEDIRGLNTNGISYEDSDNFRRPSIFSVKRPWPNDPSNRDVWSWIDLKAEIIAPIILHRSIVPKLIRVNRIDKTGKISITNLSEEDFNKINSGALKVTMGEVKYIEASMDTDSTTVTGDEVDDIDEETEYEGNITSNNNLLTVFDASIENDIVKSGSEVYNRMQAIVAIFRNTDMKECYEIYEEILATKESPIKAKEMQVLEEYRNQLKLGKQFSDYIVSSWPIAPLDFRPEFKNIANIKSDMDSYYETMLLASKAYDRNRSSMNATKVYEAVERFCGFSKTDTDRYVNISQMMTARKSESDSHGNIRDHMLVRIVKHAGRSTIIPTEELDMTAMEVGIPITMVINMWKLHLRSYILFLVKEGNYTILESELKLKDWDMVLDAVASRNFAMIKKLTNLPSSEIRKFYYMVKSDIIDYVEGRVPVATPERPMHDKEMPRKMVLFGRQPSLHRLSVRAYYVKVTEGLAIQIHPLVTDAYNADFDGDQMWVLALLTKESMDEGKRLMLSDKTLVNTKDSSLALVHTQDMRLGTYYGTMLHDNALNINSNKEKYFTDNGHLSYHYFDDIETIRTETDIGSIHIHDLVLYKREGMHYFTTAGRLLFNDIFPDGYTLNPYSNHLGIPTEFINNLELYDVKHDALICGHETTPGTLNSRKLMNITYELATEEGRSPAVIMEAFQKIMQFGFIWADRSAISYTLDDLENPAPNETEQVLKISEELRQSIDKYYNKGLMTAEDKKENIVTMTNYTVDIYKKYFMNALNRNNNVFIMLDSDARGNEGQLMMAAGVIGVQEKQKGEILETPEMSNFKKGLTPNGMKMQSFSVRVGVASTQQDTAKAGALTRLAVFLNSSSRIVERDCKREEKDPDYIKYSLKYEDTNDNFTLRHVSDDIGILGEETEIKVLTDIKSFPNIKTIGELIECEEFISEEIDTVEFTLDGINRYVYFLLDEFLLDTKLCMVVATEDLIGKEIVEESVATKLYGVTASYKNNKLIESYVVIDRMRGVGIKRLGLKNLDTGEIETYRLSYELSPRDSDLPYLRYSLLNYPYLTGENRRFISRDTIKFFERYCIEEIDIRTMLDCKSENGVCAFCYGAKFDTKRLPKSGENIAIEAAQAIGETATQLTLNKINKGGSTEGAELQSGVQIVSNALEYGVSESNNYDAVKNLKEPGRSYHAYKSPHAGYVVIRPHATSADQVILHIVSPETYLKYYETGNTDLIKDYQLPIGVRKFDLLVNEGYYVEVDQPLTEGLIKPYGEIENPDRQVYRRLQLQMIDFYIDVFRMNGIDVHARHFEITGAIQTNLVTIMHSNDPDYRPGEIVPYRLISDKIDSGDLAIAFGVFKSKEIIGRMAGPLTSICHMEMDSNLAIHGSRHTTQVMSETSIIGSVLSATNVKSGKVKEQTQAITPKRIASRSKGILVEESNIFNHTSSSKTISDTDKALGLIFSGGSEPIDDWTSNVFETNRINEVMETEVKSKEVTEVVRENEAVVEVEEATVKTNTLFSQLIGSSDTVVKDKEKLEDLSSDIFGKRGE